MPRPRGTYLPPKRGLCPYEPNAPVWYFKNRGTCAGSYIRIAATFSRRARKSECGVYVRYDGAEHRTALQFLEPRKETAK